MQQSEFLQRDGLVRVVFPVCINLDQLLVGVYGFGVASGRFAPLFFRFPLLLILSQRDTVLIPQSRHFRRELYGFCQILQRLPPIMPRQQQLAHNGVAIRFFRGQFELNVSPVAARCFRRPLAGS